MADLNDNVEQITHYYPFGMAFADSQGSEQPYKYNNKELDKELGLEIYDYVARQMDQQLGRFMSIDPLAEKYYSWSPYVYVYNNPLKYIDPDGRNPVFVAPALYKIALATGIVSTGALAVTQGNSITNTGSHAHPNMYLAVTMATVVSYLANTGVGQNTSEVNKGHVLDPRWVRNQEKSSEKFALDQVTGQQKLEVGGHNPKDPGGDFDPKYDKKISGIVRAVAGATALGVTVGQSGGNEDNRKDVRDRVVDNNNQKNDPNNQGTVSPDDQHNQNWITDILDWILN